MSAARGTMDAKQENLDRSLFFLLLAALTILGTGLRLYDLGEPSLWADEMFAIRDAVGAAPPGYRSIRIGLELSGVDVGALEPEAYHTFRSHGMTPWNMRIGACMMGCLAIPLLGGLSARLLGRRGALFFALLLSVSTWHLLWSQHARFYAPMFLFFGASLTLYFSAMTDARLRWSRTKLVMAMCFAAAAVGAKPTSNLLFGIMGADLAIHWFRCRRFPLRWDSTAIIVVGGIVCLAITAAGLIESAEGTARFLSRARGEPPLRVVAGNLYLMGFPLVVMAGAASLMAWRRDARLVIFLACAVVVPLLAFTILSTISHVVLRYTFVTTYGWLMLAALGLDCLWESMRPRLGWIATAIPVGLLLVGIAKENLIYYESGYGNRARWRHAFDYVQKHRQEGDRIISHAKWAAQFYFEEADILGISIDFCVPDGERCVSADPAISSWNQLDSNTWFIAKSAKYELEEGRAHWLDERAQFKAAYPTRIPYPQQTIRVYYLPSPDRPTVRSSAASRVPDASDRRTGGSNHARRSEFKNRLAAIHRRR